MPSDRRQFLSGMSGILGLSQLSNPRAQPNCEAHEETIRDLRQRINQLEHQLHEKETRIAELESQSDQGEYEYTEEIHEQGEKVGTQLREAVVSIRLDYDWGSSSGTGWFIDENKIATNRHVISGLLNQDPDLYVWSLAGNRIEATLAQVADTSGPDLAILETSDPAPFVPTLGDIDTVDPGEKLVRVGHPSFIGYWSMGLGELLDKSRPPSYISNAELPYGGGHSGSPVITLDGEVIGISHATSGRGTDFTLPDEPPDPSPPNLKPNYDHEPNTEVRVININKIQEWMDE